MSLIDFLKQQGIEGFNPNDLGMLCAMEVAYPGFKQVCADPSVDTVCDMYDTILKSPSLTDNGKTLIGDAYAKAVGRA